MLHHVSAVLCNCGAVQLTVKDGGPDKTVSGGGLPAGTYKLLQFHFHWGKTDSDGSEHVVDSKAYPLEVLSVANCFYLLRALILLRPWRLSHVLTELLTSVIGLGGHKVFV